MDKNKEKFREILLSVTHPTRKMELEKLYEFLERTDFFTAPASTKYHGAYEGGLVQHSLAVYDNLVSLRELYNVTAQIQYDSVIITALLHDICKINFYKLGTRNVKNENGTWQSVPVYTIDDQTPLGHGEKSVIILQQHIHSLTSNEIYAIRWHMGSFDDAGKSWAGGMALGAAFEKCPLAVLLHMADLAANYISKV